MLGKLIVGVLDQRLGAHFLNELLVELIVVHLELFPLVFFLKQFLVKEHYKEYSM